MQNLFTVLMLSASLMFFGKRSDASEPQTESYSLSEKSEQEIMEHSKRLLDEATFVSVLGVEKDDLLLADHNPLDEYFDLAGQKYICLSDVKKRTKEDAEKLLCFHGYSLIPNGLQHLDEETAKVLSTFKGLRSLNHKVFEQIRQYQ